MAQMNMKIPVDQLKDRVCSCGNKVFASAVLLKELPAIYSPSGTPDSLMLPVGFVCMQCGNVLPMVAEPESPKDEQTKLVLVN